MKSKEEIKKELHQLIDSIQDEYTLHVLNEDVMPYIIESRTKELDEDNLTEDQQNELAEAIREADAGETVSFKEFKQKMARWLSK